MLMSECIKQGYPFIYKLKSLTGVIFAIPLENGEVFAEVIEGKANYGGIGYYWTWELSSLDNDRKVEDYLPISDMQIVSKSEAFCNCSIVLLMQDGCTCGGK